MEDYCCCARSELAVAAVLAEGKARTPDLGGRNSTQEVTDAVLEKMAQTMA